MIQLELFKDHWLLFKNRLGGEKKKKKNWLGGEGGGAVWNQTGGCHHGKAGDFGGLHQSAEGTGF